MAWLVGLLARPPPPARASCNTCNTCNTCNIYFICNIYLHIYLHELSLPALTMLRNACPALDRIAVPWRTTLRRRDAPARAI